MTDVELLVNALLSIRDAIVDTAFVCPEEKGDEVEINGDHYNLAAEEMDRRAGGDGVLPKTPES